MTPPPKDGEKKIILDLCGGTGSWSRPYVNAGYDVRLVTLPGIDVREYRPPSNVYGVLAAPPCTMFSFARTNAKRPRDLRLGMETVRACLNIIWSCMEVKQSTNLKTVPLKFWALENPYYGLLPKFLGRPDFIFDPYMLGDAYKKKTALWGNFNNPIKLKKFDVPRSSWASKKFDRLKSHEIHGEYYGKYDRQTRRAITPAKFAQAFFEVNL